MDDDDDDTGLFTFAGAQPVMLGSLLQSTKEQEDAIQSLLAEGENLCGDEDNITRKRRASERDAVDRLFAKGTNKKFEDLERESDDSSSLSLSPQDCPRKKSLSPEMPASPSELPPPPNYHGIDYETQQLLERASAHVRSSATTQNSFNDSSLLNDTSYLNDSLLMPFTIRVRCRGVCHKFDIKQNDALFLVAHKLASKIGVEQSQVTLQRKEESLSLHDDPETLGLSSTDILDAFILDKNAVLVNQSIISNESCTEEGVISIRIQTEKKSTTYHIHKLKPFQSAMQQFSADLDQSLASMRFTFDGEVVSPSQTPEDLDMEDDDVIDARILK